MTVSRPRAVACDAVETLFSLDPVRSALDQLGAGADGLELFFGRLCGTASPSPRPATTDRWAT